MMDHGFGPRGEGSVACGLFRKRIFGCLLKWIIALSAWVFLAGCEEHKAYRHVNDALHFEARGQADQALAALQAAVEVRPDDAYLRRRLGWALVQRSSYEAAQAELEAALALAPHYLAAYQDLAILAEVQNMPDAATGWLEKAIQIAPAYRPMYRDLAGMYLKQGRFSEAQILLEQVVDRWPDAIWAHFRLGGLFMRLKWPERAAPAFKYVVDQQPNTREDYALYIEAHGALGNAYYEMKDYPAAEEFFKKAIELNPADHSSLNNLAWVYAVQGIQLEEGLRLSRRSLRLNPDSPVYLDTLAELHYHLGEIDMAIQLIRRAITLAPEDAELQAHLQQQLAKFLARGQGKA